MILACRFPGSPKGLSGQLSARVTGRKIVPKSALRKDERSKGSGVFGDIPTGVQVHGESAEVNYEH